MAYFGKRINNLSNGEMIQKYLKQPSELPSELRQEAEERWGRGSILAFAYVDLDSRFQLFASWLLLTDNLLVLVSRESGQWKWKEIERSKVTEIKEFMGLSCHRLAVYSEEETLMILRYSHRQSRAVGVIKFLLEQELSDRKNPQGARERTHKDSQEVYQDQVLNPIKDQQASVASNKLSVIWRLLSYLKKYKGAVTLGITAACLMTLVSLVPPLLTGAIVDQVIKPFQQGEITKEMGLTTFYWFIGALVLTYFFRELFAWVRLRTMSVLGEKVARDLRDEVYSHLHTLSLSYFSKKQTGSLISRVGSDTDRIWDFVGFGVVEVVTSLLMLAGLGVVLITLDPLLGLAVVLPVPVFLWSIMVHGDKMQDLFLRSWRKWSALTDCLSDTIPGIKVVKAFNKGKEETEKFNKRNEDVMTDFNSIHVEWTRYWPKLMLGIQSLVVVVWVIGLPRVLNHIDGSAETSLLGGITAGTFISFVLYMGMFVQPIEIIGQMARMVNRATSSAHRVFEVLDTEPQILVENEATQLETIKGDLELKDVEFTYDGVRRVLKGVNLKIHAGEMIGLVGSSGSGKSTLISLLARFYDPQGGEVIVDGHNLKSLDLENYSKHLGIVLQDPYLFHGTLVDNIRYANPEASLEEVVKAARAANAHEFICRLPNAYDTVVGERGHTLSGGERQRISIARAILRNPKILILDEATSAVDTETERKIQEALDRLVQGRTVIAIAHRLSTLTRADRLVVMDEGQIVEQGTHAELLAISGGKYKKLVDMQKGLQGVSGV